MREHLKEQNVEVVPTYKIASKEPVKEGEPPKWVAKKNLPAVSSSYHNYMVDCVIEDLMQHVLQVHDRPASDEDLNMIPANIFEFPNGYNAMFGAERFKIPEPLFDPIGTNLRILGGDMLAMQHVVSSSISMCDVDVRPSLWSNIILAGGTTLMSGFSERLTTECTAKTTSSMKVKVVTGGNTSDRIFSAWVGASILASLGNFQELWISKQEYEEEGKLVVDRKCP